MPRKPSFKVSIAAMSVVMGIGAVGVLAADPAGKIAPEPIGRVTAAFGTARADTAAGAHPIDLQSLIYNDERITTDGGGLSVLLSSRVVLKIDQNSAVSVLESP